jgi:hypothetical protein
MIMPFNKPVLVVSGSFSQDDIDRYTWCFKSPHIGSWIRRDVVSTSVASTGAITPADDRLDIPQVRVGPGISQKLPSGDQTRYILVIQGRSGANKVKLMVGNTVEQAATTVMHEALNEYSTVFSASYNGPALHILHLDTRFERSHELAQTQANNGRLTTVKLVCYLPPRHSKAFSELAKVFKILLFMMHRCKTNQYSCLTFRTYVEDPNRIRVPLFLSCDVVVRESCYPASSCVSAALFHSFTAPLHRVFLVVGAFTGRDRVTRGQSFT